MVRFGLELGGTLVLRIAIFPGCSISLVLTTVYCYLNGRLLIIIHCSNCHPMSGLYLPQETTTQS